MLTMRKLAEVGDPTAGRRQIDWSLQCMPVIRTLLEEHRDAKPFAGHRIAVCVHITKETAALVRVLSELGAEVAITGGNPQTTQDDVAHALAADGVSVFGWRGMTESEVEDGVTFVQNAFSAVPTLVVDDGGHLISRLHADHPEWLPEIRGGVEKTTAGVRRLSAMDAAGELRLPTLAVNDVSTKWDFDNTYGVGQSTIDGIIRASGLLLAGRTFVVVGFGHVGRGIAIRARGHGAHVVVACRSARTALRAALEGFRVEPIADAIAHADFVCTATGLPDVVAAEHLDAAKDGVVLCNSGWSNIEIELAALRERTESVERVRNQMDVHRLRSGKRIVLLSEGGMVNLDAAEGNPSEVMDLGYANVVLSLLQLLENPPAPGLHTPPDAQDQAVARLKLASMGVTIDEAA
ncbi:adenosylhomocysteinase [Saccharopolyspora sp. NPDC050389]|uniref:adenosylhomocysteinase n=1 Tax=Saccharopolyspora sp. NPDC050389 TaxID=3155516 RepID=UPI00340F488B